ncbi:MAG: 16S rRNA (uracil(1498)-N(3))-methyltransferase [Parvularculaceae bacterium]
MIPRLHIDAPLTEGAALTLGDAQTHYLKNVMRREVGAALKVFNARDGEFAATITSGDRKRIGIEIGARLRAPAAESDLWLLFALIKRDAIDLIIEKATELGVSRFLPILTERTQSQRINLDRLSAIATEAAEQCGRLSVPAASPPQPLDSLLRDWPQGRRLFYCDEAGDDPAADWGGEFGRAAPLLDVAASIAPAPLAVLIGPEGGFSPTERARLRALSFVSPASLGPRILRADTAAIASLSVLQASVGDWRRR